MHDRSHPLAAWVLALGVCATSTPAATVANPVIWADIPDPSIVRVGSEYFMSHTTMHMAPGVPIMKSPDLVNWKTIGYCYSTLVNNENMNLANGKTAYGKGSWASSIRHKSGTYRVLVPSYTSGRTHLYSANDPTGPWQEVQLPFYHDPSLHMDDDGRNFVVYGGGDIKIIQLNSSLTGVQSGGVNKTLISSAAIKSLLGVQNPILVGEGAHVLKHNGWYYIFLICWPNASGYEGRTQLAFRSRTIDGAYEGKVVLSSRGVAQGSVVQDPSGNWWGYLFQDNGSVGRSPWIMPVTWSNDWPVFNNGTAPTSFSIATSPSAGTGIVTSDDFSSTSPKLEWQWNHNPDNANWSLTQRPGWMRIKSGRVDAQVVNVRNTLTQRSFGPKSSGRTVVDVAGLKDGDVAGLVALQYGYGYVGVKKTGTNRTVVMVNAANATPTEVASVPVNQDRVYLRIDMDFTNRTDKATFFWSTDSTNWKQIGNTLQMSYKLEHFMGYRFGLFNMGTRSAGGTADFDWFQIGASASQAIDLYPKSVSVEKSRPSRMALTTWNWQDGSLAVRYTLPEAGRVSWTLIDLRGRVVARRAERFDEAGAHIDRLDVAKVPEGSYVLAASVDGASVATWPVSLLR